MAFRRKFSDQIPKWQPWTWERILGLVASLTAILTLLFTFFRIDDVSGQGALAILLIELAVISIGLLIYIVVISSKKLHRFAQTVFHTHYVNHVVRDHIASLEQGRHRSIHELMQDIVDVTASCYSVITGKQCRCCVQGIDENHNVTVLIRDSITSSRVPGSATPQEAHKIEDNTDFFSVWYGANGCVRFFFSRNLCRLWLSGKYKNTSFNHYGHPETNSILGMTYITKWTLPYKSTIVWPIRYISEDSKWPILDEENMKKLAVEQRPFIWGFLSVDCRSRNVFDSVHGPEIGAAVADALFSALHAERMSITENSPKRRIEKATSMQPPLAATNSVVEGGA